MAAGTVFANFSACCLFHLVILSCLMIKLTVSTSIPANIVASRPLKMDHIPLVYLFVPCVSVCKYVNRHASLGITRGRVVLARLSRV